MEKPERGRKIELPPERVKEKVKEFKNTFKRFIESRLFANGQIRWDAISSIIDEVGGRGMEFIELIDTESAAVCSLKRIRRHTDGRGKIALRPKGPAIVAVEGELPILSFKEGKGTKNYFITSLLSRNIGKPVKVYLFRARERPERRRNPRETSITLPFAVGSLPAGAILMKAAMDSKRGRYLWFGPERAGESVMIIKPGGKKERRRITREGIVLVDCPVAVAIPEKNAIKNTIAKIDAKELTDADLKSIGRMPGLLYDLILKNGDFSAIGNVVQKLYAYIKDALCGIKTDILLKNKLIEIKTWVSIPFTVFREAIKPRKKTSLVREKLIKKINNAIWRPLERKLIEGMRQILGSNTGKHELFVSAFMLLPPGRINGRDYEVGVLGITLDVPQEVINASPEKRNELIRKHIEKYRNSFIDKMIKFLMEEYEPGEIKVGPPLVDKEEVIPEYEIARVLLEANAKKNKLRDEKDRLSKEKDRLSKEKDRLFKEKDSLKDELIRLTREMALLSKGESRIADVERRIKEVESRIADVERRIKEVESRIADVESEMERIDKAMRELWMGIMRERRALVVEYLAYHDQLKELIKEKGLPWPEEEE